MKVFIGGVPYKYKEVKRPKYNNIESQGLVCHTTKEIVVTNNNGKHKLVTVIHEVVHALCYEYATHAELSSLDEKSVDVISHGVAGALRQLGLVKE